MSGGGGSGGGGGGTGALDAQHTDFRTYYRRGETPLDLWKTNIQIEARTALGTYDLGPIAQQLTWQDQSADVLANVNSQVPLTGMLTLTKPGLRQYSQLLPPQLIARIQDKGRVARQGALGVLIVCSVGYGRNYIPIWAMRVVPGNGTSAEETDLSSGSWQLNLADDLWLLAQSSQDFKFNKGKKHRRQGWRAHEIAVRVCRQHKIPVKRLVRTTAYFDLSTVDTTSTSPIEVIRAAYDQESKHTGKTFVIRWAAPDKKHPHGALEVVRMRRNPNLLIFRDQLIEASLTRSQSNDFCTVVEARGHLKHAHGAHKGMKILVHSPAAVKRYGWVRKIVDFGSVNSHAELKLLGKRALAQRLTPIRGAELTHPGVATIRRGDAIRIDIPEEGYAAVDLKSVATPNKPPGGFTALELHDAEKDDPAMFGLPDPSLLSATGAANNPLSTSDARNMNQAAVTPVADQGIAFVTSVQHNVSQGSYTVDIQTSFVDVLDPGEVRAMVDQALRKSKSASGESESGSGDTGSDSSEGEGGGGSGGGG